MRAKSLRCYTRFFLRRAPDRIKSDSRDGLVTHRANPVQDVLGSACHLHVQRVDRQGALRPTRTRALSVSGSDERVLQRLNRLLDRFAQPPRFFCGLLLQLA